MRCFWITISFTSRPLATSPAGDTPPSTIAARARAFSRSRRPVHARGQDPGEAVHDVDMAHTVGRAVGGKVGEGGGRELQHWVHPTRCRFSKRAGAGRSPRRRKAPHCLSSTWLYSTHESICAPPLCAARRGAARRVSAVRARRCAGRHLCAHKGGAPRRAGRAGRCAGALGAGGSAAQPQPRPRRNVQRG